MIINPSLKSAHSFNEEPQEIAEDPAFLIISKIDNHISKLKSGWNPFKHSAEEKINSLNNLKEKLLTKTEGTINELLDEWIKSNHSVLTQHRNVFKIKSHSSSKTATETFVDELKLTHGTKLMASNIQRKKKRNIYQPFMDYIHSRTSWVEKLITFLFRDSALSEKKIVFAEKIVTEVKDFSGSYAQLHDLLKNKQTAHTAMSRAHNKNHFNLEEERRERIAITNTMYYQTQTDIFIGMGGSIHPDVNTSLENDVRAGEDDNRSRLADIFHDVCHTGASLRK